MHDLDSVEMQEKRGMTDTQEIALIKNVQRFVILILVCFFVVFIFQCIALTHSDTEAFRIACGSSLRDWMIADTIINSVGLLTIGFIILVAMLSEKNDEDESGGIVVIAMVCLYLSVLLILGIGTLAESVKALNDAVCEAAMKDTEMALIGITFGGLSIVSLTTAACFVLCFAACCYKP
jgi:hypothetical protein